MSSSVPFGRRVTADRRLPAAAAARAPMALTPQAEAFRQGLAAGDAQVSEFEHWRRARRFSRWVAWGLSFALTLPGMLCFLANAPSAVSAVLEVVGLVLGFWLRRARRRRIAEVAAWESAEL